MKKPTPATLQKLRRLEIVARFPFAELTATPFEGRIASVSTEGWFAVVELDSPVKKRRTAVIDADTRGRIMLMQPEGKLSIGMPVEGMAIIVGDALKATDVGLAAVKDASIDLAKVA